MDQSALKYSFNLSEDKNLPHNVKIYQTSKQDLQMIIEETRDVAIEKSILYQLFKQKRRYVGFETLTNEELRTRYFQYLVSNHGLDGLETERNKVDDDQNIKNVISSMMEYTCSPYLLLQTEMANVLKEPTKTGRSIFTIEIENEYDDYPIFKIILLFPDVSDVNYVTQHLKTASYAAFTITDDEIYHLMSPITMYLQMSSMFVEIRGGRGQSPYKQMSSMFVGRDFVPCHP